MTQLPCISVVTPVFNGVATLERNLESVHRSRHWVCEHIIQDNNSTDGTRELLLRWQEKTDGFVRPFFEGDTGIADGFNRGIRRATGKWIAIQNADDWYDERAFLHLEPCLDHSLTIIHGMLRQHREDGVVRELGRRSYNPRKHFNPRTTMAAQHPTCVIGRDVYDRVGLYDTRYTIAMDFDFLLRAHLAGIAFCYVPEIISNFSRGGKSSTDPVQGWREMRDSRMENLGERFHPHIWFANKVLRHGLKQKLASIKIRPQATGN